MTGPSFQFVGFSILVAVLLSFSRTAMWRQSVMVVATLVFLTFVSSVPAAFVPFAGFVLLGFLSLRLVAGGSALAFRASLVLVLASFFWIKKYIFVPEQLWITSPYVTVGISYILFRMLHLLIEAKDNPAMAKLGFMPVMVYLTRFNTLIAGPIQYYDEYADAETEARTGTIDWFDVGEAAQRIVVGLFKTNILAAVLDQTRLDALGRISGGNPSLLDGALTFGLYPFFLYCNFSGYIDIVVGATLLMGHRLPENFDQPFRATSTIEFWNRWHITLSRWLRTYVYNPLLMSLMRHFPSPALQNVWAVFAFFFTFFLIGVWHGQTGAFLFFGLLSGLAVSVNKITQLVLIAKLGRKPYQKLSANPFYEMFGRGLNITWWGFSLTWFWASWGDAQLLFQRFTLAEHVAMWIVLLIVISAVLEVWVRVRGKVSTWSYKGSPIFESPRLLMAWYTALLFVVAVNAVLSIQSAPKIVYKDF